ncbi:MAG TPA: PIN domain-containing protein [Phycisphaerales bacterium]|nr:PIN domain-containing protein [Phycisphaerales bacterium]
MQPEAPFVLDTNVLVYALFAASSHHERSRGFPERAITRGLPICLTPQVVAEFAGIATDPRRVTRPRSPEETADTIAGLLALPSVSMLSVSAGATRRWLSLLREHGRTRQHVFDLQLAATMLEHEVRTIYTFNTGDFEGIAGLIVRTPMSSEGPPGESGNGQRRA